LRLSSNARLSVAPNKGHNIASDDPDFVAAEVQRLVALARTRAAGSW
jgi:pimeloyl-ACP methyl ester carboxylesterase